MRVGLDNNSLTLIRSTPSAPSIIRWSTASDNGSVCAILISPSITHGFVQSYQHLELQLLGNDYWGTKGDTN